MNKSEKKSIKLMKKYSLIFSQSKQVSVFEENKKIV